MNKIKDIFYKVFRKKQPQNKNPITVGDSVRLFLKSPNEFGIQSSQYQYTFSRISEEDFNNGFIDGSIEQIKINGPIKVYEIASNKKRNNRNYIVLYSILDEEIKDYKHLETVEKK